MRKPPTRVWRDMLHGVVAWLVVAAVVCAPMAAAVVIGPDGSSPSRGEEPVEALKSQLGGATVNAAEPVDKEVTVVVELNSDAALPTDRLSSLEIKHVYTRQGARHLQGTLPLTEVRQLSRDSRVRAIHIEGPPTIERERRDRKIAPGTEIIRANELHAQGITGENVTVGVIGRAFRPSDPAIAGSVGAHRVFDADDDWVHGTAVASVVADTAPDATLHLAAIGPSTTPAEYRRAVEWLKASGADVIVDAGSYFGSRSSGAGDVAAVAEAASDDVVFVTSAGNYANRHWSGIHRPSGTPGDWVTFGDNEGNALNDNDRFAGRVTAVLQWNTSDDYDLYLLRVRPGDDEVVAGALQDGPNSERLSTRVPRGRYYLAVRTDGATSPTKLELFANRNLATPSPNGSLTSPAVAPGVLAVGAYRNGSVRAFSSRGPVGNRTGVTVVAPDNVTATGLKTAEGTSYAAPYVAGTAALLQARHPTLTPAEIRSVIRDSAHDVGPPGPDVAAGDGLVDARAAHDLATERVLLRAAGNETT